jgi:hypothetical protein
MINMLHLKDISLSGENFRKRLMKLKSLHYRYWGDLYSRILHRWRIEKDPLTLTRTLTRQRNWSVIWRKVRKCDRFGTDQTILWLGLFWSSSSGKFWSTWQNFCVIIPLWKIWKILKKYLMHLTRTFIYSKLGYGIGIISHYFPELQSFFGDFIKKYGTFEVPNFW